MNMKTTLIMAVAAMCLSASAEVQERTETPRLTRSGKVWRPRPQTPNGGMLEVVNTGKVIQVVNAQTVCPAAVFEFALRHLKDNFRFPMTTTAKALKGPRDEEASARVVVVAKKDEPTLLCAPEEGWSVLNVIPLMADNPDEQTLKSRVDKELLRALCMAYGCGNSSVQPCVMRDIKSLKDLDGAVRVMSPDTKGMALGMARFRGSQHTQRVSYRRACQEGWAPPPTNDIQKAIWDKEHEIPTKPMKIEFTPKSANKK